VSQSFFSFLFLYALLSIKLPGVLGLRSLHFPIAPPVKVTFFPPNHIRVSDSWLPPLNLGAQVRPVLAAPVLYFLALPGFYPVLSFFLVPVFGICVAFFSPQAFFFQAPFTTSCREQRSFCPFATCWKMVFLSYFGRNSLSPPELAGMWPVHLPELLSRFACNVPSSVFFSFFFSLVASALFPMMPP